MNFLSICQKVDEIIGTQGTISTVTSLSGYQQLLVDYTTNAWLDIQNMRKDWKFMKRSITFNLVAGQVDYTIFNVHTATSDPVGFWDLSSFRLVSDWSTLRYVDPYEWETLDHSVQVKPKRFTVYDNSTLGYLSVDNPNALMSCKAYYYKKPQSLSANTDTPTCPEEFHWLLIHQAAADIGAYLGNIEVYTTQQEKADRVLGAMMRSQIPGKRLIPRRFI